MFHRIFHESWTEIVPIIGFALTAAVFLAALVKALRMTKSRCQELAALPLENSRNSSEDHPPKVQETPPA